jgi:hypothetical protein
MERGTHDEGVREWSVEDEIWTQEGLGNRGVEKNL